MRFVHSHSCWDQGRQVESAMSRAIATLTISASATAFGERYRRARRALSIVAVRPGHRDYSHHRVLAGRFRDQRSNSHHL